MIDLLKEIIHEAVDLDPKRRDVLLGDVKRCESSGGITGVLELKLDVAILRSAGMSRADAEEHVYVPAFHGLIVAVKDAVRQLRQMQGSIREDG